jgi:type IV secretory pathway TrbL component
MRMNWGVVIAATLLAGSAGAEGQHEGHAHHLAKEVDAFHAALAPLWHAPAGRERSRQVCAQAPKLASLAQAIRSGDSKPLLASLVALKAQCQANPADIDGVFSDVHEAFHRLAEHGEH